LGQKQTYAVQGVSALPPKATANADSRKRSWTLPKADNHQRDDRCARCPDLPTARNAISIAYRRLQKQHRSFVSRRTVFK
jgi:hypothetical protein